MSEFILIPGHERYEINSDAIIRNATTKTIKKQYLNSIGYLMVSFSYKNKSRPLRVHRLLASAFIPNPDGLPHINHKDGNKTNNTIGNLEWCTHAENMTHAFKTGLANNTGIKNGMAKLSESKAKQAKEWLKQGYSQYRIARNLGVSRSAILKIKLGKTWNHV